MIRTRSYYLTAAADDSGARSTAELAGAASTTHPDLAGRETVELPYRTLVFRARRR